MSFFAKAKNKAIEVKIRGEIALIDREIKTNQQEFGKALYDLLEAIEAEQQNTGGNEKPLFLVTQSKEIQEVYIVSQFPIRLWMEEIDSKRQGIETSQETRQRAAPVTTNREKMERAGSWVSSNSKETKFKAEIALLERKIRQNKELFGVNVFELLLKRKAAASEGSEGKAEFLNAATTTSSVDEIKVRECFEKFMTQHEAIIDKKLQKEREIEDLK